MPVVASSFLVKGDTCSVATIHVTFCEYNIIYTFVKILYIV